MAKRNSAEILEMPITEDGKMVRIVRAMCYPAGRTPNQNDMRMESYVQLFSARMIIMGTPQQKAALIKLHDMGWEITNLVRNEKLYKIAFAVALDGCAAWVGPDGKLERAPVGKRTAYLDRNWADE